MFRYLSNSLLLLGLTIIICCGLYPLSLGASHPTSQRELCDPIDGKVYQAWQDRAKILADRNFEPSAGFDNRDDGCDARPSLLAADVYPIAAPKSDRAHGVLGKIVT
jgi:hypothetical protein